MPSSSLPQQIRRIEIKTSKLVNDMFGGRYHSTFKGRGMEFVDVREYIPGDDIRNIHWNITARLGHPYIKRFTEERELTILVAIDVSNSLHFGTKTHLKSELVAELVSILAFSALKNNDKMGILLFSDRTEKFIPPRKSKSHVLRLIRDVLEFQPESHGTNISAALEAINRFQKKRAVVFVISDFMSDDFLTSLKVTRRRHDTIAFVVRDEMEYSWPKIGALLIEDSESKQKLLVKHSRHSKTNIFSNSANNRDQKLKGIFRKYSIDHVFFQTNQDYVKPLITFFQERANRFKH